jgi:P-type E1-E2 ATPase
LANILTDAMLIAEQRNDEQPWLDIKLVGAFGLQDKVRGKAKSPIKHTGAAGINVRMISGDMEKTAEAVAW